MAESSVVSVVAAIELDTISALLEESDNNFEEELLNVTSDVSRTLQTCFYSSIQEENIRNTERVFIYKSGSYLAS